MFSLWTNVSKHNCISIQHIYYEIIIIIDYSTEGNERIKSYERILETSIC